ncbi:MAG: NAD(P)/FAD-dependent oxidoreductase [Bacteroidota bacterium]
MNNFDVIVVGAGAAGLIAAGHATEMGGKVLLLEKMERAGRKLLITGKGRCNITNSAPLSEFFQHIYPNGKFLKHAFSSFFSNDVIALLEKNGLETVVERGGRVFPASNKSADVVDSLLKWVLKNGVELRLGHRVESLIVRDGVIEGVNVVSKSGKMTIRSKGVILTTGGKSYPATGSDGDGYRFATATGHSLVTPLQALVPIETEGDLASRLQGLSLKNVKAMVWVNGKKYKEEFGEMLFAHFGMTGPIILTLSRFVVEELHKGNKVDITIDLKPALDEDKLDKRLIRDLDEHGKKRMDNIFRLWLPSSLVDPFLQLTGVEGSKEGHQLSSKERRKIMLLMKNMPFRVTGCRPFREAIITSGGVATTEIDSKSMESKRVGGLYFAGELIDLDADTGGFNLQIAFSTGWLAADASIRKINAPSQ